MAMRVLLPLSGAERSRCSAAGEARSAGRGVHQCGRAATCSTMTIRICGRSSIRRRRSRRRRWPWPNSAGCPVRRCCTPSCWAPRSSAGSAMPVSPGHYARGWHITATCGVFGSAVASAKLLGLDAAQTSHALGIAASQSAGVMENLPSAAKNVGVGNAARNGLFAALLAEQGYTAAPARSRAASAGRGRWATRRWWPRSPDGLGERWEVASEHLQAVSVRHRDACRGRCVPGSCGGIMRLTAADIAEDHRIGRPAVARSRRPDGDERAGCAGQHPSLRCGGIAVRRGRAAGVFRSGGA